jgi:hypothetical protein
MQPWQNSYLNDGDNNFKTLDINHVTISIPAIRPDKTVVLLFGQVDERDAGAVAVLQTDDLHADRQTRRRKADRCDRGR